MTRPLPNLKREAAAVPDDLLTEAVEATGRRKPSETVSNGPAAEPKQDDRGSDGRFAPGNRASRGNPFARKLGAMRSAFLEAVGPDDVRAVARRLLEMAKAGDLAAAQLIFLYGIGKPTRAVDVDALDLHEFQLLNAAPTKPEVQRIMVDAIDPAQAAEAARAVVARKPDPTPATAKFNPDTPRVAGEQAARTGRNVGVVKGGGNG